MKTQKVRSFILAIFVVVALSTSSSGVLASGRVVRPCDFSRVGSLRVVGEPPDGYVYQHRAVLAVDIRGIAEEPFLDRDSKERMCSCWAVFDYYRPSDRRSSEYAYVFAQPLTAYPVETQFAYSWRRPEPRQEYGPDLTDCEGCDRLISLPALASEATYVSQWQPTASFYGSGTIWIHTTGAQKALVRFNVPLYPSERTVAYASCGGFFVKSATLKIPVSYYHRNEPQDNPVVVQVYRSWSYDRTATWESHVGRLQQEEARELLDSAAVHAQGEILELDVSDVLRRASPFSPIDFLLVAQGEIAKGVGISAGIGNVPITLEIEWLTAQCYYLR